MVVHICQCASRHVRPKGVPSSGPRYSAVAEPGAAAHRFAARTDTTAHTAAHPAAHAAADQETASRQQDGMYDIGTMMNDPALSISAVEPVQLTTIPPVHVDEEEMSALELFIDD